MRKFLVAELAVLAALTMGEARATPLSFGLVPGMGFASGPPYPTSNVGFDINLPQPNPDQPQPNPDFPVGRLLFHLGGANGITPIPEPDFPFSLTGSVLGGNISQVNPIGLGGVVSFGLIPQPQPDDIALGLAWDIGPLGGSTPVLGLTPQPIPDLGAGNSFFDVFFTIAMGDGSVMKMQAHFQIFNGQPFTFANTTASLGNSIDVITHLMLINGGTPNGSNPAFSVVFTGNNQVPEPATLTLLGTGLLCFGAMHRRKDQKRA